MLHGQDLRAYEDTPSAQGVRRYTSLVRPFDEEAKSSACSGDGSEEAQKSALNATLESAANLEASYSDVDSEVVEVGVFEDSEASSLSS